MYSTKNFSAEELTCKCCGEYGMDRKVVDRLQELRNIVNRPLKITSAYRCKNHPAESKKSKPGTHNQGIAVDIYVANGAERHEIMTTGLLLGARGIGIAKTFVHLDWREGTEVCWTY